MPLICLGDIAYKLSEKNIFRLPALTIEEGQHSLILGPSGCGKSTLLNLISGAISPNAGIIEILGHQLNRLSSYKKDAFRAEHMGIIFQQFNLLPFADVYTNISLGVQFSKERKGNVRHIKDEICHILEQLNLEPSNILAKKANQLSVGQQQRIAAARALLGKPKIILADEPTSALDDDAASRFIRLVFDCASQQNSTLIMVSHNQSFKSYFNHIIELSDIATVSHE
ncbi:MAG: ATP-binding cassette domain-containing protein [Alphaproteobacteria bacterium]